MSATLVLAAGSRAGTEAPLLVGYYMIGREADCQIRPKSRSVSRRHCLVHHQGDGVRVFDLGSTSGTTINNKKIAPKSWVNLEDGDLLRLGKIGFHLRLGQTEHPARPRIPLFQARLGKRLTSPVSSILQMRWTERNGTRKSAANIGSPPTVMG